MYIEEFELQRRKIDFVSYEALKSKLQDMQPFLKAAIRNILQELIFRAINYLLP